MKAHLSDSFIAGLSIAEGKKRVTVSDLVCEGLSLELRATSQGSWRFRFSFGGRQKLLTIGQLRDVTLSKAREKAFVYRDQLAMGIDPSDGTHRNSHNQCPSLDDFVEKYYLPHIRSYKRCVTADITLLKNHLLPAFGQTRLNAIKDIEISRFIHHKIGVGYKPAYCNRFLVLLGFIYNLAIKWDIVGVTRNPVRNVSLIKVNNKIERFLSRDEATLLMDAIKVSPNPLLRFFVPLALTTGARKRELLDSKWEDFDFERRVWVIPMTKSGRPRHVPLVDAAIDQLAELKKFLPTILEQASFFDCPWLFPNPKTGKPFQSIFHAWDSARRKAGLSDVRIHDLRHSFASALVNNGVPIYDVQKLLGHRDIKTTERYAHLAPERLRKSASIIHEAYDFALEP